MKPFQYRKHVLVSSLAECGESPSNNLKPNNKRILNYQKIFLQDKNTINKTKRQMKTWEKTTCDMYY